MTDSPEFDAPGAGAVGLAPTRRFPLQRPEPTMASADGPVDEPYAVTLVPTSPPLLPPQQLSVGGAPTGPQWVPPIPPAPPVPPFAPLGGAAGGVATWPAPAGAVGPTGPARGGEPPVARLVWLAMLVGALVGALVAVGAVVVVDDRGDTSRGMDIGAVLSKVQASVVSIEVDGRGSGLFGGAGSGVVISSDGLVLTNAHVIDGAASMEVIYSDGSRDEASLVGSLPQDDIALIRVKPSEPLVAARLGSSADVRVGDEVLAIGNALDLGGTPSVTQGIVSATDRSIDDEDVQLGDLIQTDAAINPGNSGGPLVDADGRVVGINTAIIRDAQNIGFSIAIDSVKPLIEDIKSGKGEITPDTALLGVASRDVSAVDADVLEEYDVEADSGAFVVDVSPDTAAADAGIEVGDVIVAIDGEAVGGSSDVRDIVRSHKAGDTIELEIERGGQRRTITATLGSITD